MRSILQRSHNTWESDEKFNNSLDEIMAMLAKLVMYSTSLNFSDENKNEVFQISSSANIKKRQRFLGLVNYFGD